MKKLLIILLLICTGIRLATGSGNEQNILPLTLEEAIMIAQLQSVDAAVALNELKTAYWSYRTHKAEQLPEVNFTSTLPYYGKNYDKYQNPDGTNTYVMNNAMRMSGELSVDQNIPLTGGRISLLTALDFTRQFGGGPYNEFLSNPVGITFTQPIFGVNIQKWNRKIEPVCYEEAKAAYIEKVEWVTLNAISHFFNLLIAKENVAIATQNLENADKLYEIAIAKREIGHISESELMQLNLSALQAKAKLTEEQSTLNARMFQLRAFLALGEEYIIEPVVPESVPSIRLHYQEVLEKALTNNAFAKNILRRQLEADFAVATAKGNRRDIQLFATVGYSGKDRLLPDAYRDLMTNQVVQVGISVPLLDWGKRKGQVKVAESNREVTLSRIRQEELSFNQDIFLLVENFNNQAAQLEIARQADAIAEKRYNTSIETFMIGKISTLDLNDAQRSKDEARQKHIQELYYYWSYYYNVRSLTLYDFFNDRTIDADIEQLVKK
ncbi:MAG: TolC family protein [Tannerellaceae bacterium]|nr:TolC family protein [Tannerellaceae bacterium]